MFTTKERVVGNLLESLPFRYLCCQPNTSRFALHDQISKDSNTSPYRIGTFPRLTRITRENACACHAHDSSLHARTCFHFQHDPWTYLGAHGRLRNVFANVSITNILGIQRAVANTESTQVALTLTAKRRWYPSDATSSSSQKTG